MARTEAASYLQRGRAERSRMGALQQMRAKLLKMAPFEIRPFAEKGVLRGALTMLAILDCRKFDTACVIGNLQKTVIAWPGTSIDDCALCKCVFKSGMQHFRYKRLPIVVVDLNRIEPLEAFEMVKQVFDKITPHMHCKTIGIAMVALPVCKNMVRKRGMRGENLECAQKLFALPNVQVAIIVVPMEQRPEVKRNVLKATVGERLPVSINGRLKLIALIMKDQGDEIEHGFPADVAGFVNENRELPHGESPQIPKMPGGTPRPLTAPSCEATACSIARPCLHRGRDDF